MRRLQGRLEGGADSGFGFSMRGRTWWSGGGSSDRRPRRTRRSMQLPPRAGGGTDPEREAAEKPHFRLAAVPTAIGPAGVQGTQRRLSLPLLQGCEWSLQNKHCLGLWGQAHPLDHCPPSSSPVPGLMQEKTNISVQLEHLLALNTKPFSSPQKSPRSLCSISETSSQALAA